MTEGDSKVNILLVDDRWENLVSLKAVLDGQGYNLVKASSGREALRALLDDEFALILLDVQMPVLNGFETAALIKQRDKTKHIPIIFITGLSIDEQYVFKGYETGAVDYIIKPFNPSVLRSKVAVFADLYRKTKEIERQAGLLREAELKRLEVEALKREQAANQRYRELVNGIHRGIVWTASPFTYGVTYMSPQVQEILGCAPEECLDVPDFWERFLHPEDRERFFEALRAASKERTETSLEHRLRRADGSEIWLNTSVRLSASEAAATDQSSINAELRGLSVDITHLKRTEEALSHSEERLRFLAAAGIAISQQLDYKEALEKIVALGVPTLADYCFFDAIEDDKIVRKAWYHRDPGKMPLLARAAELRAQTFNGQHPSAKVARTSSLFVGRPGDFQLILKTAADDEHRQVLEQLGGHSFVAAPVEARGRNLGVLTFVYSDSKRVYGEQEIALIREVARRAALGIDNARLFAEAQSAIRLRDEFLSIASHELKTPLTPLKIQVQGLRRLMQRTQPQGEIGDKLPKILETSDRQIDRINRLVDELLDVSRINSGKFALELERVNLADVVRESCQRFASELVKAGCDLKLTVPSEVWGVLDRLRMEQIISNLLTNAMRYAPNAPVEVSLEADDAHARLRVRDHGMGIAQKDQDRIFQRFERAVPMANFGGLGLGLYIVRQILEAHGGTIHVESKPGDGAAFTVEVPLSQASVSAGEATAAIAAKAAEHRPQGGLRAH